MKRRNLASSLVWSLAPMVCVLQFLGHGFLWLALSSIRKIFQLRYKTGYAALVLLERSHLQSSLMCASYVVFRMKTSLMAVRCYRGSTGNGRMPAQVHPRAR